MRVFPERSWRGIGLAILRVALTSYVLLGILLYLRQDEGLFFPPATPTEECDDLSHGEIVSMEGTQAYYVRSAGRSLAIIYHGNAERACDEAALADWVTQYGYDVLVVEYSGYAGDTSRKPSVGLLLRDVEHVNEWVRKKNFSRLLIIGRSIGTGFASYHAALASPEKLLLIAPFDSLSSVARSYYPIYPVSLMLKTELDNVATASFAKTVLIIHGTEDTVIPIEHGRVLFEKLPQKKKTFVPIRGYGHDDALGTPESWSAMRSFLISVSHD